MSGLAETLEENQRLRELLAQSQAEKAELETQKKALATRLEEVVTKADLLARALEALRLKHAGPVSERFTSPLQAPLPFGADFSVPPAAPEPAPELNDKPEQRRTRSKRKPRRRRLQDLELPETTVEVKAEPSPCASCGGDLRVFDTAVSYRIDWVPGHFRRLKVVRDKCSCPNCPGQGVLAPALPFALPQAMCSDGLVARIVCDKFCDHIPLNRQVDRMKREGFATATSTLCGWVSSVGSLLSIIARAVRLQILESSFVQGDDTGLPVQDGTNGAVRKGRLWAFTDQSQVFYGFSATKAGEHPTALLAGFESKPLLLDGGSEFNQAVKQLKLERAGCWAHLRRYFFEARAHHPELAVPAILTIRDLFLIERAFYGLAPEERHRRRQEQSKPLVDGFFEWVNEASLHVRPESTIGKAIGYARSQRAFMETFLDHGELPMHNNLSELMLRQPIVGRKNWLFAGSEGGAEAATTFFTLISSCRLQALDPEQYLRDVLRILPRHPSNRVHELTPWAWASRS